MEHDDAIRLQAAEKYVAGELAPGEKDAFEEHFFDCAECAEEVRWEMAFAANTRAAGGELQSQTPAAPEAVGWWNRLRLRPVVAFSFGANLALAAALVFVVTIGTHREEMARFAEKPYFAPGPAKGAADIHEIAAGEPYYTVHFPVSGAASLTYNYEVLDEAGQRQSSGSLQGPAGKDELYLQIPVARLSAGVHTLVVRGGPGGEIVSWSKFQTTR